MQVYNILYKVTVASQEHGERIFIVTAQGVAEAVTELQSLLAPWSADSDLTVIISVCDSEVFVVITDKAHTGIGRNHHEQT